MNKMTSAPTKGKISIAKMFPLSWISKLRQGNGNDNGKMISGRKAKNVKRNAVGLQEEKSCKAEKFYGEAAANCWRLSSSDEGVQGRKCGRGCDQSLSYNLLDETEFYPSTCRSCGGRGVVSKVVKKKSKDFDYIYLKTGESNLRIEAKSETNRQKVREPTNRDVKYAGLKSTTQKMVSEKEGKGDPNIQNVALNDIIEVETVKPIHASIRVSPISPSSLSSENRHREASTQLKLQSSKFREVNLEEMSLGAGEERKSIYISRSKAGRRSKVKVYSPRTPSKAELCKIRALEDMKKTRMKTRVKEKAEQGKTALESLAVVKQSFDPQRDFRNSMLEMILDKGISRQEELEELLACYLILNSDGYHDLIIKVFRQVWFDLNKDRLDQCHGIHNQDA